MYLHIRASSTRIVDPKVDGSVILPRVPHEYFIHANYVRHLRLSFQSRGPLRYIFLRGDFSFWVSIG
jgi:hypothetical protein